MFLDNSIPPSNPIFLPVTYHSMESSAEVKPLTTKLELRTAYGPVFRDVLNVPPRDCTSEEIPIIDLTPLKSGDLDDRKKLGSQIKRAAMNTGFFYIRNHGISEEVIASAKKQLLTFVGAYNYLSVLTFSQIFQAARGRQR